MEAQLEVLEVINMTSSALFTEQSAKGKKGGTPRREEEPGLNACFYSTYFEMINDQGRLEASQKIVGDMMKSKKLQEVEI